MTWIPFCSATVVSRQQTHTDIHADRQRDRHREGERERKRVKVSAVVGHARQRRIRLMERHHETTLRAIRNYPSLSQFLQQGLRMRTEQFDVSRSQHIS